ncbi:TetR/AcrR family transcriptional regulator [Streptomyces profundus]|uniref:TetR/AcrR family transcriptional regulator n=1 Tax=Streptomyces profundus TaxID=2867410 RepID=UPI001D162BDE|nr:TetR/AcrR family transcriptional regulator [Streptomyces sp. MA3_2.13]UED86609.1 TetR/AcrR family transcriptional regulator [Streptomyces sp. MA3_2.13]
MTAIRTARARARQEVTLAIKDEARRQLAAEGAAKLSLRAVARELGMVSSALYRYFPGRDELLTALIVDAYTALGDAVEAAVQRTVDEAPLVRWLAACHAARDWAIAHPHEYGLIHGTPVPGYAAPNDTSAPASRLPLALVTIATDALHAGRLAQAPGDAPPPEVLADVQTLVGEHAPELDAATLARLLAAWGQLLGLLSMEVFGQFNGVVTERRPFFTHATTRLAANVGVVR